MTTQIKIYIAAAAIILAAAIGYSLWSCYQIRRLEDEVNKTKQEAASKQSHADELEKQTYVYKEKIEYLETSLAEIRAMAAKQDEELEKIDIDTHNARADVDRARRIRSAAATADELCAKLAELGHACKQ